MLLIVGLGNPGESYKNTRHNFGFMLIDELVAKYNFVLQLKFHSHYYSGNIDGKKVIMLKPLTFMNRSGLSVIEAANFFKLENKNILVIHDELDLPLGKIKIKMGGGDGGHNGLKDITGRIGADYKRLRLGVGRPQFSDDVSNYVLNNFSSQEAIIAKDIIKSAIDNFSCLISSRDDMFMNKISLKKLK